MRILFLHSGQPDYLADGLFHGLRQILQESCVDVPRHDMMYSSLDEAARGKLRGQGFTLYGLLPDFPCLQRSRERWIGEIDQYDLIVIANIWRQVDQYLDLAQRVHPHKLVILDGADATECFPYAGRLRMRPRSYFSPIRKSLYVKRELMEQGGSFGPARYFPRGFRQWLGNPKNVISLGFSIPEEKICRISSPTKTKDFNRDMVDSELTDSERSKDLSSVAYPFRAEAEYYADLQASRFGVTTKRAGWDCLRHYEIAANGAVLAFRQLNEKPKTCAPHGLGLSNCLIYHDRVDLERQISKLTPEKYARLQAGGSEWIRKNTTIQRANELIEQYERYLAF